MTDGERVVCPHPCLATLVPDSTCCRTCDMTMLVCDCAHPTLPATLIPAGRQELRDRIARMTELITEAETAKRIAEHDERLAEEKTRDTTRAWRELVNERRQLIDAETALFTTQTFGAAHTPVTGAGETFTLTDTEIRYLAHHGSCRNCGHRIAFHHPDRGYPNDPCTVEGCDCPDGDTLTTPAT